MSVMFNSVRISNWIFFPLIIGLLDLHQSSASVIKQEGDPCLIGGELRGICTNYQQCRSAQDLIKDGAAAIPCNPQERNSDLICCAERGRREISQDRRRGGGNNLQSDFYQSTQNAQSEEVFDEIETIFDAKKFYQDSGETGRKKHSIAVSSFSTRRQNSEDYPKRKTQQPIYISQEPVQTTSPRYYVQPVRRPINEHIDLNYNEDDHYNHRPNNPISYYPNQGRDSTTSTYEKPTRRPAQKVPMTSPTKPTHQSTTRRYYPKVTASPWQEPPRPLVEDGNGYPQGNFFGSTVASSTPKREKRISEIKCKEYSELVTETIAGLPLTTDPKPVEISIQKCNYNAHQLIVGGQNTSVGEFPHMAAVGFLDRKLRTVSWSCGGTLISDNFVLTAAHCTTSSLGSPSVVRLGEHNLVRGDDGAHPVDYLVKEVVRHPDYRPPKRYNDIALLRLSRHVSFTNNIRPACLYTLPNFNTGKTVATGWGRIQYAEEQSDVLLKVVLSIIDNHRCSGFYKSESKTEVLSEGITNKQMCAGELTGGKDTCQGDSGGPIEVTSQGNKCVHHVIGITSFGKRCGQPNAPGVYTRVSAYLSWIEEVVWPELVREKIRN